jgi:phycobilisome rod-core linker protein
MAAAHSWLMALPLLEAPCSTQNSRVPLKASLQGSGASFDQEERRTVIEKSYKQIFFHALKVDREPYLESQYLNGSITAKDFIRGLLLSDRFLGDYYQCSSNYRMVDQVIGRVLGRQVYSNAERLRWSIVIADQGFPAFVDQLLDSDEYLSNFGLDLVPYQRSRLLPGRSTGELPIYQQFPRYGADWRDVMAKRAPSPNQTFVPSGQVSEAWVNGQPPAWALKVWLALAIVGGVEITRVLLTVALAALRHS